MTIPGGVWVPRAVPYIKMQRVIQSSEDVRSLSYLSDELQRDREVLLHAGALGAEIEGPQWHLIRNRSVVASALAGGPEFHEEVLRLRKAVAMVRRHPSSRPRRPQLRSEMSKEPGAPGGCVASFGPVVCVSLASRGALT